MGDRTGSGAPWHLWVIGVIGFLWSGMGAFDYFMTQTNNEIYLAQFTPAQLEFFTGFPLWLNALWAIAVWGGVIGAVLLLLRNRLAAPVFLLSFLSMAITAIHNFGFANGYEIMGSVGAGFTGLIFLVALFLVLYSRAMARSGVLN